MNRQEYRGVGNGKVRLRALEPEDVPMMFDIENDVSIWRYSERVAPLSRHQLMQYALDYDADPFRAGQLRLVIESVEEKMPVGLGDFYEIDVNARRAYLGLVIGHEWRGRGFALAAVDALERYSRDVLHLRRLAAKIASGNTPSIRLFEQLGYSRIAALPEWFCFGGEPEDLYVYCRDLAADV